MAESRFATMGKQVSAGDSTELFSQFKNRRLEFANNFNVFIAAATSNNNKIHAGLILQSTHGSFYLAWIRRSFRAIMLHRLAQGLYISGMDNIEDAETVLSQYLCGEDSENFGLSQLGWSDSSKLRRLTKHIQSDLDKELVIQMERLTPDSTNCIIFPLKAAVALGIPVQKVGSIVADLAYRYSSILGLEANDVITAIRSFLHGSLPPSNIASSRRSEYQGARYADGPQERGAFSDFNPSRTANTSFYNPQPQPHYHHQDPAPRTQANQGDARMPSNAYTPPQQHSIPSRLSSFGGRNQLHQSAASVRRTVRHREHRDPLHYHPNALHRLERNSSSPEYASRSSSPARAQSTPHASHSFTNLSHLTQSLQDLQNHHVPTPRVQTSQNDRARAYLTSTPPAQQDSPQKSSLTADRNKQHQPATSVQQPKQPLKLHPDPLYYAYPPRSHRRQNSRGSPVYASRPGTPGFSPSESFASSDESYDPQPANLSHLMFRTLVQMGPGEQVRPKDASIPAVRQNASHQQPSAYTTVQPTSSSIPAAQRTGSSISTQPIGSSSTARASGGTINTQPPSSSTTSRFLGSSTNTQPRSSSTSARPSGFSGIAETAGKAHTTAAPTIAITAFSSSTIAAAPPFRGPLTCPTPAATASMSPTSNLYNQQSIQQRFDTYNPQVQHPAAALSPAFNTSAAASGHIQAPNHRVITVAEQSPPSTSSPPQPQGSSYQSSYHAPAAHTVEFAAPFTHALPPCLRTSHSGCDVLLCILLAPCMVISTCLEYAVACLLVTAHLPALCRESGGQFRCDGLTVFKVVGGLALVITIIALAAEVFS